MNSFVDLTLDVSAVPAKPAGAGRYVYELARELSRREDVRPTFVARRDDEQRWEKLPGYSRVSAVAPTSRPLRLLWEQFRLPSELRSISARLHHGPHYTLPHRADIPMVVTIHDMTFFDNPEWHERSKVQFFCRAIKKATRRADRIVCVSADTATRLQERFGERDVRVITHGVDHERFRPARDWSENEQDRVLLSSVGIEGEFIAFVGTVEPRKDVPSLVKAFNRIAADNELKLVIAGRPGWGSNEVEAAIAQSSSADRIIRVGFLADEVVPALMRCATAVAYPSLFEGFGLPALEALACGAPLVTTTGSAIEEVVENAALLITPGDVDSLADALQSLVTGSDDVKSLKKLGPEVAAKYTWQACADAHVEVYKSLN